MDLGTLQCNNHGSFKVAADTLDDVAKLVFWAIASGSTTVSLYDYKGFMKLHQIELLNKLAKFHKLIHLRNNFKLKC